MSVGMFSSQKWLTTPFISPPMRRCGLLYETLRLLQLKESQSINQTMYDSLRQRPIAISIETKTPNAPEEQAGVQLGVWVAAHFTRLRGLVDTQMPTLPLLFVTGHDWHILFAASRTAGILDLYGKLRIGDTSSLLGINKLISALRRLAQWVTISFKGWLESYIFLVSPVLEKE
ncbi:hypothetical protein H2199_009056 [Coniosporium tulheliwenetii]|uniref:Uncharacterized protein n=1 Tax=Coniosporium tulheliwenetii TaxID=3383036 RepID=A0ACC2YG83_9PEZI|nr:hypothetical protein H2199_009056 [Cladosporium sp. JES 115]